MNRVRVRYAPSPTGHLHIGNARTALFNYLFAKHYNGDFILRIEDTDIERNVPGGEESQNYYLNWLGIIPDESPTNPNPKYAPYRQMERLELYLYYANLLIEQGDAYKCYCTPEELEADYELQRANGEAFTSYNRRCLHLDHELLSSYEAENRPFTIRVKVPDNENYPFDDMIRGHVEFESKDIGDWVLIKANGIPTYNFAVVIDDHTMEISHVFRGEEHLTNTPKQIMIYRMLGWETPLFGHMTLIVNEQHKKLSKRDNQIMQFMSQYKDAGYLPEAMFNFMSLLGWSPEGEKEIFTKEELINEFTETRLSKSPSMFDKVKLAWINNCYMKELNDDQIIALCKPFLAQAYDISNQSEQWVKEVIRLYHSRLSYGSEIVEQAEVFFKSQELSDEAKEVMLWETTAQLKPVFYQQLLAINEWNPDNIKNAMDTTKALTGIKGKALFMGLRVLITNITHGPDFVMTVYLLGKDKVLNQLLD
jgi:nondiscriminating glutamyl-tRNA synthetase